MYFWSVLLKTFDGNFSIIFRNLGRNTSNLQWVLVVPVPSRPVCSTATSTRSAAAVGGRRDASAGARTRGSPSPQPLLQRRRARLLAGATRRQKQKAFIT